MTKQEAIKATSKKFTNLYDGSVLQSASVSKIIEYYESLLINKPITVTSISNIESNFIEEQITLIENNYEILDYL